MDAVLLVVVAACGVLGCKERAVPAAPHIVASPITPLATFVFSDKPVQHADVLRQRFVPGLGQVVICRADPGEAVCELQEGAPHRLWPQTPEGVKRVSVLGVWQRGPVLLTEGFGDPALVALVPGAEPKQYALPPAHYEESAGFGSGELPAARVSQGRALFFRVAESEPTDLLRDSDIELESFDLSQSTLHPLNGARIGGRGFAGRWLSPAAFVAASQAPHEPPAPVHSTLVFAVQDQTLETFLFEEHNGAW